MIIVPLEAIACLTFMFILKLHDVLLDVVAMQWDNKTSYVLY